MSEARLCLYRERGDAFVVAAEDHSTDDYERHHLRVLAVVCEDPWHDVRYRPGMEFDCGVSKTIPGASAYANWTLEPIAWPA